MVKENIRAITQRIARCCEKIGTPSTSVSLVCVTKEAALEQMVEALEAGVRVFGENRVQGALSKYRILGDKADWHLIGHLQTNKAKEAVRIFGLIHSLDSMRLAEEIDRQAGKIGKIQNVLIQVNVSQEASKFGVAAADTQEFVKNVSAFSHLAVKGLMTIAPETGDQENVRPYFRQLRQLLDAINELRPAPSRLRVLSMGMTNDFEVAIEEGSTMVRIGRAIFS